MSDATIPRPELHSLNVDFSWEAAPGPLRRVTDQQARQYSEQGFFLLENAFDPDEVARVIEVMDPFEAETEAFLAGIDGGKVFIARSNEITFTTHLVRRSDVLRSLVSGPVLTDLCHDLIGPDVRLYWDQAVYKKPGTEAPFPWHQDNGYTYVEPQQYLTCWIALTDATIDNGCPQVVPGLHRSGTLAHEASDLGFVCLPESTESIAVEAPAGSVVVFSSLTPHSTGPNLSDGVRKAYIVQYAPDGAEAVTVDTDGIEHRSLVAADDRQFIVLADGDRISA
jgi:phytanoyl-CoA hydroxylase